MKHYAVDKSMHYFVGTARVFDEEEEAVKEVYEDKIKPGDMIILRYKGLHAAGMPEMLKLTEAICNKTTLSLKTALITDGRFSGATKGPSVGYVLPEAADNGPLALLHDGDLIEIDVNKRSINLIGINSQKISAEQVMDELEKRQKSHIQKEFIHKGAMKFLEA